MNKPVIVIALVLACIFSCYGLDPDTKAAVEECKAQHNIESGQIKEAFANKKLSETENGRCFMTCIMEKMSVIKDGKIETDRAMEINEKKFKDPESRDKANEIIKRCSNVKATDKEKCSLFREIEKCAIKNALELKLEIPMEEL